jgi:WD40 repeat protein
MGTESTITALSWSPDSRYLASTDFDNKIRIWDAGTGEELADRLAMPQSASTLFSLDWSSDGSLLAGAGADGNIFIWDTRDLVSGPISSATFVATPTLLEPPPTPQTKQFDAPVGTAEERAAPMEDDRCWPGAWFDSTGFLTRYNLGYYTGADLNLNIPSYNSDHNAPVYAIGDGTVIYAVEAEPFIMLVIIQHERALVKQPDGTWDQMTVYARYRTQLPLLVSKGDGTTWTTNRHDRGYVGTESSFRSVKYQLHGLLVENPFQGVGDPLNSS